MAAGGAGLPKRLATLLSGLLECGAFCGIIFGWASLVYVLKKLGYFEELCVPTASPSPNSTLLPVSSVSPCPADHCLADCTGQDEQFSLIFTIGSFMNNFMTFPMGYIFDRFGTTVARLIAISFYTTGTLLVAFSTPGSAVLLFPAMSLLSVGGILLILTNMQVGNLFGKYRSIIITLYNGAFDSSSAIFLIIKVLYERGLSLRDMFLFMAGCSAWHLLRTLFLMPRRSIPYPLPLAYNYGLQCEWPSQSYRTREEKRLPGDGGPKDAPLEAGVEPPAPRAPKGGPAGVSFRACVCSRLFAWHVVWLSTMQLRHYLFIGTLNPLLDHLAHNDSGLVSTYTNAFAFTQLCGVLCAPWNGLILDRHKRGKAPRAEGAAAKLADLQASVLSLVVTVTQCLLFSICAAVPVLPVQFATFALQVLSRSFLYGGNAAFLAIATSGSSTDWPWPCRRSWPCCSTPASPWCRGRSRGTPSTATMPPYLLLALALLGSASARHLAALEAPKLGSSALEAVAEVSPVALEDNSECPRDNETVRLSLPGALGGTTYRYVIVKQRRNFHGAQKFCYQCYRGRLASIHSYNSNACLWRKARSRTNRGQVWIGAVTRPLERVLRMGRPPAVELRALAPRLPLALGHLLHLPLHRKWALEERALQQEAALHLRVLRGSAPRPRQGASSLPHNGWHPAPHRPQ
ncbi:equilibrative nucleobase transporter 1 isoform X3 [Rhea pennata]|uniref:equilibrative nucleobase transporter 1 isoform X3 n=1 Tax=Rhea pennata TaxID=8795 RepID=UPI002E25F22A